MLLKFEIIWRRIGQVIRLRNDINSLEAFWRSQMISTFLKHPVLEWLVRESNTVAKIIIEVIWYFGYSITYQLDMFSLFLIILPQAKIMELAHWEVVRLLFFYLVVNKLITDKMQKSFGVSWSSSILSFCNYLISFNWNHFEMRLLNLRINLFFIFYLLRTFCPHLGSFCVVSSFTTFRPNFTSGLLQVILPRPRIQDSAFLSEVAVKSPEEGQRWNLAET